MKHQARTLALAVMLAAVAGCNGCSQTPYKRIAVAYHTLRLTRTLAEDFDGSVAKYLSIKHAECKAKHQPKTEKFAKCIQPALKLARTWTGKVNGQPTGKGVLPALQSAQRAAAIELRAAFEYVKSHESACSGESPPKKCSGDWKLLLRPSFCAMLEVVDRAVKIGAFKATQNATYKSVAALANGLACDGR